MKKLAMLVLMALFPMASNAEGLAVSGKVGTLGTGLELTQEYSDSFIGRLGFNTPDYNASGNKNTVEYDSKMQLQTVSALVDWYPMHSAFRATTGLYYNNKLSLTAKPPVGPYNIGGTNFTAAAEMSSMQGPVSFNQVAPYIGLGWGNPTAQSKGWGLVSDVGLLIQGQPNTALDTTCGVAANPTQCAALQSNQSNFKLYPVATVGVSYQW